MQQVVCVRTRVYAPSAGIALTPIAGGGKRGCFRGSRGRDSHLAPADRKFESARNRENRVSTQFDFIAAERRAYYHIIVVRVLHTKSARKSQRHYDEVVVEVAERKRRTRTANPLQRRRVFQEEVFSVNS